MLSVYKYLLDMFEKTPKVGKWLLCKKTNPEKTSWELISPTDGSKSKVLRKKKSRWGNETAELSPVVAHIPTPTLSPTVSVPGIATHIKLGQGANIKSALPCKYDIFGKI